MQIRKNTSIGWAFSSIGLLLLLILTGCEAPATPLPAVLPPTPTEAPQPTLPPPLRYALTANTAGYIEDLALIRQTGLVEQLSDNLLDDSLIAGYDVVITYGTVDKPDWQRSPITPQIALVLNTSLAPLNQPEIQTWLHRAIHPQMIVDTLAMPGAAAAAADPMTSREVRNVLANAGYPDGIELVMAFRTFPGVSLFADQWLAAGFQVTPLPITPDAAEDVFRTGRAHFLLVIWTTPEERAAWETLAGADHVQDLYALPISYRANPDLTITFTPGGFPIAIR